MDRCLIGESIVSWMNKMRLGCRYKDVVDIFLRSTDRRGVVESWTETSTEEFKKIIE